MAEVPASAGAAQRSSTSPSPGVAAKFCGADGVTAGVAVSAAAAPWPMAFSARTSKAYSVSLARPLTVTVRTSPAEVHAVSSATDAPSS